MNPQLVRMSSAQSRGTQWLLCTDVVVDMMHLQPNNISHLNVCQWREAKLYTIADIGAVNRPKRGRIIFLNESASMLPLVVERSQD